MKFLKILLVTAALHAGTTFADPADCFSTEYNSPLPESQISWNDRVMKLWLSRTFTLAEGTMPSGDYVLKPWGQSHYRLDVRRYFPNPAGREEESYMYFKNLSNDGIYSRWEFWIFQFAGGTPFNGKKIFSTYLSCIDD